MVLQQVLFITSYTAELETMKKKYLTLIPCAIGGGIAGILTSDNPGVFPSIGIGLITGLSVAFIWLLGKKLFTSN